MPMSASPEPRRPLIAVFLMLGAALPSIANGAPTSYYGVQLPDPLHVYTLQEIKPENIRNDPFLVVFKTHIPSLRPYEIPYFPSKDHLSAEEQDENSLPLQAASSSLQQEQTTAPPSPEPVKDQGSGASTDNKVKGDEQIDLEKLPELVELKPEALLEALDASKQDAEESVTARPEDPATFLSDAPSNIDKESVEKSDSEKQEVESSASKTSTGKEKIDDNSFKKQEEKENYTSNKEDSNSPPQELTEKGEGALNTVENDDNNKKTQTQKENEDKEYKEDSKLDVDRVEKEDAPKVKEK